MKLRLAESGPPVEAPAALGVSLALDALVALALLVGGSFAVGWGWIPDSVWTPFGWIGPRFGSVRTPWVLAGYALLLVALDVSVARMKPVAITWRRRLGYLALLALMWTNGPFGSLPPLAIVTVIVWVGATWIALVLAGRELSRAIANATGEDKPE